MKHVIDFDIYTRGATNTLIVIDTSDYFERPSNPIIEVTFPGVNDSFATYYTPKSLNVLNTKLLNYAESIIDFPDGLYNIRMSVGPNENIFACKNYLKLDKFRNRFKKLFPSDCEDLDKVDAIYNIDKLITAASINENINPDKAVEFYKEALKRITKLECNGM